MTETSAEPVPGNPGSSNDCSTPAKRSWWVYLLACKDGRTYAGVAVDVQARFRKHQAGKGAKFTRANRPVEILGMRAFPTRSAALQAEHALKQLAVPQKLSWARASPPPGVPTVD
jgi:putative endonuclease